MDTHIKGDVIKMTTKEELKYFLIDKQMEVLMNYFEEEEIDKNIKQKC